MMSVLGIGAVRIPPLGDSETRVSVTVRDVYGPDARFQDREKIACPLFTHDHVGLPTHPLRSLDSPP